MLPFVSILVLMEVTLKVRQLLTYMILYFCFNPCFNGSDSKRKNSLTSGTWSHQVSILVLMEVTLKGRD